MNETNEILVWQYEVPVVSLTPTGEFDVWLDEVPVEDIDEGFGPVTVRRRAFIF
jgi:hypothetical protein